MKSNRMFLVTYEINTLPFNTLVLADSQEEAEQLARPIVQKEAQRGSHGQIRLVEEVDLDTEHYVEY